MVDKHSRPARETRLSYNRMSRFYDVLAGSSERRLIRKGIEKLGVKAGEKVLDVGCGTGTGLLILAELAGNKCNVSGIDVSEGMLEKASRKLSRKGLTDRVELIQGDATHLPYSDSTFNALFMSFFLELLSESRIPLQLAECRRVLKRKGRLCVVGMSKETRVNLMSKLYRSAHKHFPRYVDCRPIELEKWIGEAGFQVTGTEPVNMWGLTVKIITGTR